MKTVQFALVALTLAFSAMPLRAATLTADTSRPEHSTFALGESVKVLFKASGLAPSSQSTVSITIKDEHDAVRSSAKVQLTADAAGDASGVYVAPSSTLGFYRVYAALPDGATIPKLGNRVAGYVTYAVVHDPATRTDYGESDSMFGMQGGFNKDVPVIPYLGVRWVLGGYGWDRMEKDHAGQFAEDRAKALAEGKRYPPLHPAVDEIRYNGKSWRTYDLPGLNGTPLWAAIPGSIGSSQGALNEAGRSAWKAYCTEVAKSYTQNNPDRKKHYYQVTWEPVYAWGYKGTNEQLVEIYRIAYAALRAADPYAIVLGPTGDNIHHDGILWHEDLFKVGLTKYIDGITLHPYFPYPPEKNGLVECYRELKDVVRRYAGRDIPLYGTEQGMSIADGSGTDKELAQARCDVRQNLITLGEGFVFNYAFYIAGAGYDYYYNCNPKIQFGTNKLAPRPVAPAYAAMTYLLDGHRTAGAIEWLGGASYGYIFQRGDDVILALWDVSDKPRTLSLPVGVKSVTQFDWMGNWAAKSTPTGSVDVTLTQEPIYIKGVSTALWGRLAVHPIAAAKDRTEAFPGDSVTVDAVVTSPNGKPGSGLVTLDGDARLNLPEASKAVKFDSTKQKVSFTIKLPSDAVADNYSVKLTLVAAGSPVGAAGATIVVRAPLSITSVGPAFVGTKPALAVEVANATTKPLTGKLNTRVFGMPGGRAEQDAIIPASGSKVITVTFDNAEVEATVKSKVDVKIETPSGARFEKSVVINFMGVPHVATTPKIDGDLSEWAAVPGIELAGASRVVRSAEFFTGKLSARVKYAWDEAGLYIAYDVKDPVFMQPFSDSESWKADCLQLAFNLDPDKASAASGNDFADQQSRRYTELTVALTPKGPEVNRGMTYDRVLLPGDLVPQSRVKFAAVRSANGVTYELAIPWRELGASTAPKAGARLGIAGTVNDMNRDGQRDPTAIGLFDGIASGKDPAKFGQIVLEAK
ncbi:MAG TPA: sugar-binding protein [Capsulimonadaceae bacterium]|jgi:hypothetical protein